MLFLRCLLLLTLALFAALAPGVDAAIFGIHDHIGEPSAATTSIADSPAQSQAPIAHHCDFSVSPAVGVWCPAVSAPLLLAALPPSGSLFAARYTPLVPTAPPRA